MDLPRDLVGEMSLRLARKLADDWSGQRASPHIAQRRIVDHIIGVPGAKQIKEIQPALVGPCAEPGEAVITDLRAEAVVTGVPRAGVIDSNPGRTLHRDDFGV